MRRVLACRSLIWEDAAEFLRRAVDQGAAHAGHAGAVAPGPHRQRRHRRGDQPLQARPELRRDGAPRRCEGPAARHLQVAPPRSRLPGLTSRAESVTEPAINDLALMGDAFGQEREVLREQLESAHLVPQPDPLRNVCAAVRNSGTIVLARVEATMPYMRTYPRGSGSTTWYSVTSLLFLRQGTTRGAVD